MAKRPWWISALGICAAVSAVGMVGLVLLLLVFSYGMSRLFVDEFVVENRSGEVVEVVPIGVRETKLQYVPIPRFHSEKWPRRIPDRPVRVSAGDSARIAYNWDDVNFRHILIRDQSGRTLILDTDKRGTRQFCYPPEHERYVIPEVSELPLAPTELLPCFKRESVSWSGAKEYPEGDAEE